MIQESLKEYDYLFIVYAPQIKNWSAGNKALHLICRELNKIGLNAWIAIHGPINRAEPLTLEDLQNKVLIKNNAKNFEQRYKISIGIYPETIKGNPLNTDISVAWILNYAGLLGHKYDAVKKQFVWAYSQQISADIQEQFGIKVPTLFLPVINLDELRLVRKTYVERTTNKVLYCQKFRALGGIPSSDHKEYIEIHRFGKRAQNREDFLRILRTSSELVAYENTTAILESQLLGTPIRCVSNKWFDELIAISELPQIGITWDIESQNQITDENIYEIESKIQNLFLVFQQKLRHEVNILLNEIYVMKKNKIRIPSHRIISRHSVNRFIGLFLKRDFIALIRFGFAYIKRNI